ncbi:SDR family oxidoreductase [Streptomyces sp. NPDC056160]|uniref:SDR family oxidoreductase n=1 Tax=Streptomyces sp. NPDC056160 TaxID=3345731 RepID=UPI0035E392B8
MTTILVTGGTGTLGRPVVERLRADGHEVRALGPDARPHAAELREGGPALDAAVAGADTVVHCAGAPRGEEEGAAHLIAAARRAGVGHLVLVSVVGAGRVPLGPYRSRRAVERLVEESGLGWTVLRTTRAHDVLASFFERLARPPVMLLPAGVREQPVEAAEVAGRLAALAVGAPAGRVPDMGGPEVRPVESLARAYLRATARHRPLLSLPLPGRAYRGLREGEHLAPRQAVGSRTFEEYLTARFGPRFETGRRD